MRVKDIIHDEAFRGFLTWISTGSFFLASVLLSFLLMSFLSFDAGVNAVIVVVGTVTAFFILKTEDLFDRPKVNWEGVRKYSGTQTREPTSVFMVILLRVTFFNVLRDLFILLVYWCVILSAIVWIAYLITSNFFVHSADSLLSVITVIGVLSGIMQYYLQQHKENVTDRATKTLVGKVQSLMEYYSLDNFMGFLQENYSTDHGRVVKALFKGEGSRGQVPTARHALEYTINNMYFSPANDHGFIMIMEQGGHLGTNEQKIYDEFFEQMYKEADKELESLDIGEQRRLLLPNIIFFDDIQARIASEVLNAPDVKEDEPLKYMERLRIKMREHAEKMLDRLLQG